MTSSFSLRHGEGSSLLVPAATKERNQSHTHKANTHTRTHTHIHDDNIPTVTSKNHLKCRLLLFNIRVSVLGKTYSDQFMT